MLSHRSPFSPFAHRILLPVLLPILLLSGLLLWSTAEGQAMIGAPAVSDLPKIPAEQVTIISSKDNTLYYNDTGSVSNGIGEYFFAGNTASMVARRGVLAFDLTGQVPAWSQITDVELRLFMSKTISGDQPVSLHRLLNDWGEGLSDAPAEEGTGTASAPDDATWLHTFYDSMFWTNPGGDFLPTASATASVGGIGWYTWTVTTELLSDVQLWVNQPGQNFGWLVMGDENEIGNAKRFNTHENLDSATVPTLSVSFIPPKTVYLPVAVLEGS